MRTLQSMNPTQKIATLILLSIFAVTVLLERGNSDAVTEDTAQQLADQYRVAKVIDGDTVDVIIDGEVKRIRMIGVNTPETVDPRKPVECFGREASDKMKSLLTGNMVMLESDPSQGDYDKYGRLLRYIRLSDGTNINKKLIAEGYAYEYTYDTPYKYQADFKAAQSFAENQKLGLWGDLCKGKKSNFDTASMTTALPSTTQNGCTIKGNINAEKERIYHTLQCDTYSKTSIDESVGERWFCSESEALAAGWRKAVNC